MASIIYLVQLGKCSYIFSQYLFQFKNSFLLIIIIFFFNCGLVNLLLELWRWLQYNKVRFMFKIFLIFPLKFSNRYKIRDFTAVSYSVRQHLDKPPYQWLTKQLVSQSPWIQRQRGEGSAPHIYARTQAEGSFVISIAVAPQISLDVTSNQQKGIEIV